MYRETERSAGIAISRILKVVGLTHEPTTVAQARDNEQLTTSAGGVYAEVADASRDKPLPVAWLLFTAVWLLFPVGFVHVGTFR